MCRGSASIEDCRLRAPAAVISDPPPDPAYPATMTSPDIPSHGAKMYSVLYIAATYGEADLRSAERRASVHGRLHDREELVARADSWAAICCAISSLPPFLR